MKEIGITMIDRLKYIMDIAKEDENIRGVLLYGSRANKEIIPDQYQDYDIIYIANDKDCFDTSIFKDVKLSFTPSKIYPELFEGQNTYFMLLDDDSRVDLTICTIPSLPPIVFQHSDNHSIKCLLDKDDKLHEIIERNKQAACQANPMDETIYNNTCSEFFWEIQNMVKGLKRDELSFTMFIRDISMRDMLNRMIDTYIGMNYDYKVSVGTLGKYRKNYLPDKIYQLYKNTYLSNTTKDIWCSLNYMIDLFRLMGKSIAENYNYHYPEMDEQYVRDYVSRIKELQIKLLRS